MSEDKATEKISQHLETLIHEITSFASDFSALPALLGKPPGTLTLDQFLAWFEEKSKRHPSLWLKIVEVKVNVKDNYRAECFVKLEYSGTPKELTRPGLAIYDFDKKDGRWACAKIVTMGGLVGDGADL
ncbi:hypothetical protein PRZ48_004144 [Zasmidium cellare]|uniref:SnoaL-like domain-containing protein n=1 Tax=Zasmidium cellare TaxID=395010 RepID=A0ABR0EX07_ZASCE|nr:hypothetical protein PRZ48_004144 [Zasmidium cellare]